MMTYEDITREVREICGAWLTEAQIDATAKAVWAVKHDEELAGQPALYCLGGALAWMVTGKMIPGETWIEIARLAKRLEKEDDETCGLAN